MCIIIFVPLVSSKISESVVSDTSSKVGCQVPSVSNAEVQGLSFSSVNTVAIHAMSSGYVVRLSPPLRWPASRLRMFLNGDKALFWAFTFSFVSGCVKTVCSCELIYGKIFLPAASSTTTTSKSLAIIAVLK